jgi:CubicO group peptidase (beta-lactamase class C family)
LDALRQVEGWGADNVAVATLGRGGELGREGEAGRVFRWASVTKPVTALACLVAAEEGTIDLDQPAGPPGSTVRHLLAHASGLPFDGDVPIAPPGRRRIYSNTGFEELARVLEASAEMPFAQYVSQAVLEPLEMRGAELRGDAGAGLWGTLQDLVVLARELLAPTLVATETLAEATSVQFPGVAGVLPDWGRYDPNDWGLGFELKDAKESHWMGTRVSPRAFGHFGGSGTFLWVDPAPGLALGCLTDREFGDWAKEAWPALSDAVVEEVGL